MGHHMKWLLASFDSEEDDLGGQGKVDMASVCSRFPVLHGPHRFNHLSVSAIEGCYDELV